MNEIPRNIPSIEKLGGAIESFLELSRRINEGKPQKYWYPLSMPTYGTEEVLQALDSLCSFQTTMGEKTLEFEKRFADHQNSGAAVMVNSGSSADLLMCHLLVDPIQPLLAPGSEVLTPVVTWPTQLWSVMMAGLKLKLVDVDPETLNIDLADLERSITPSTKALFLVHLMGNPCPMDRIQEIAQEHSLTIVEDCCEALDSTYAGVKVGNFGLMASYSFFFSHHMTTMEGGMVVCRDEELVDRLKMLRAHGWLRNVDDSKFPLDSYNVDPRYAFVDWGLNVRPTELQAGFGLCQLEKLPGFNQRRRRLARRFFSALDKNQYLSFPDVDPKADPCWFALPIMVKTDAPFTRHDITNYLESQGIETRPIVAGNIARQPVARLFPEFKTRTFQGADKVHENGFYMGLSPLFSEGMIDQLLETLQTYLNGFWQRG
ncbi:DegT/DnrJ/EryC1/StrS family aminotransferase [Candidatus Cryosericum septentrionale]|uniref:DegT/DnrJ/EryC1/StrS family aminotransferase n=1 Tax=Candidatus Cryosericum septentrionale TaxID=2290913 RepID=UPI001402F399|nr:DegT/DnrJ/EryC1/StrS family aminotransferase [Candidatus Cryosericum septentrionale]